MLTGVAIQVGALVAIASFFWKAKPKTHVIRSPIIGFFNLIGPRVASLVADDNARLGGLFARVVEASATPPSCDVLLIYCDIGPDGSIDGTRSSLREIIHESGAAVVLIASDNAGAAYIAAAKRTGNGKANLVMTLQRNDASFAAFFGRVFAEMKKGVAMPVAWVKYAPQIPGQDHPEAPGTIFACELGQIAFE